MYKLLFPIAQVGRQVDTRQIIDDLARTPLSEVVKFVAVLTAIRLLLFPLISRVRKGEGGIGIGILKIGNELLDALIYAGVFVFLLIRPFGVQAFLIPSGSMWPTLYVDDFIVANKAIYRYSDPKPGDIVVFRPPVAATEGHPEQIDKDGDVKVDFIKRLIGAPGQVIELRNGVLYRDGKPENEPHRTYSECVAMRPPVCKDFRSLTDAERDALTMASFKLVKYKGQIIPLNFTVHDVNSPFAMRSIGENSPPYSVATPFTIEDQEEARRLVDLPAEPIPAGYYLMMGDNRNGSFDSRGWGLVPRSSIIGRSEFIWLPFSRWGRTR